VHHQKIKSLILLIALPVLTGYSSLKFYALKILIVEDEKALRKSILAYLKQENYICETAEDYQSAIEKIEVYDYDCILLDISLPDGNGLQLLEQLKASGKTDGVIIISAKNALDDRIKGLNLGADDYLSKPFHLSELSARIASVIRRRKFGGHKTIVIHEMIIDPEARTVLINNNPVELSSKEYDLLIYFITNKNRVISKNAIAEHLAGEKANTYANLDVVYAHIKNLKRKIQLAGGEDYIESIYGMGYKFNA